MGSRDQAGEEGIKMKVTLVLFSLVPILLAQLSSPPPGQRCAGRNYNGRRCCTPAEPCGEGEGDCDGAGDGGGNDGDRGCRGDLVCGSNNCRKYGLYYHEKDDCCEPPPYQGTGINIQEHWSEWGAWSACDRRCGLGHKTRVRHCNGSQCTHSQE